MNKTIIMTYYVILDNQQTLHILDETEVDFAFARGAKSLKEGTKKECEKYYDEFVEESGYTGPIWDKIEMNI